jgi:hypothetical protein
LPSSLTTVLSSTLVCSTSPPVSVCGTGTTTLARAFSRQSSLNPSGLALASRTFHSPLGHRPGGFASRNSLPAWRALLPPDLAPWIAHHSNGWRWGRNLNRLSITYAFPPRLRPASPAADQHRCGTLGHSVGRILTPLSLLMPTFALVPAPGSLPLPLLRQERRSPTMRFRIRGVGGRLEPRWIVGAAAHRPVSYYALFQGWLLLSQPPGCLGAATTLPT